MSLMAAGWHAGQAGVERLYRRAGRALLGQTDSGSAGEACGRRGRLRNTSHSHQRANIGWCEDLIHALGRCVSMGSDLHFPYFPYLDHDPP
jgi:hypothetical protein